MKRTVTKNRGCTSTWNKSGEKMYAWHMTSYKYKHCTWIDGFEHFFHKIFIYKNYTSQCFSQNWPWELNSTWDNVTHAPTLDQLLWWYWLQRGGYTPIQSQFYNSQNNRGQNWLRGEKLTCHWHPDSHEKSFYIPCTVRHFRHEMLYGIWQWLPRRAEHVL